MQIVLIRVALEMIGTLLGTEPVVAAVAAA